MRALVLALHGALALACTQILVPSPTGELVVANTIESGDYVAEHEEVLVHLIRAPKRLPTQIIANLTAQSHGRSADCSVPGERTPAKYP